jgi:hypothetical protein
MYKPLDIRVGQRWRCRDGRIVTVVERLKSGNFLFIDKEGSAWLYPPNGKFNIGGDGYELINLVEDVPPCPPEPAPAKPEISDSIRTGTEPFYVLIVDDDSGGRATIPEGSNLGAVLRQRAAVGDRYGTTYIAECRIIPELTHDPL